MLGSATRFNGRIIADGSDKACTVSLCRFGSADGMGVARIYRVKRDFWGILYISDFSIFRWLRFRLPVVGEQFFEVALRIFFQSLNYIVEIAPWFNAVTAANHLAVEKRGYTKHAPINALEGGK